MGVSAALVGAGAITVGAVSQASALKLQAEQQSRTASLNQRLADLQAEDVLRRGEKEARRAQAGGQRLVGRQRAALAAQGIDISSGTALAAQEDVAEITAREALTIRNNAWREAWGLRIGAVGTAAQVQFAAIGARAQAQATLLTGGLGAARELLGGAAQYRQARRFGEEEFRAGFRR